MKRLFLVFALLFFVVSLLFPQVPKTINYQGLLTTSGGAVAPDGNYNITFSIYPDLASPVALWTETQSLSVEAGMINAVLGPINIQFSDQYCLGIAIGGNEVLSRQKLNSVPYALSAQDVFGGSVNNSTINNSPIGETTSSTGKFTELKIGAQKITKFSTDATLAGNSDETLVTEKALKAYIDALAIPAGTIMAYGGTTAPPGWLLCDGSAVSRTTYSKLYTAILINFGKGDGSTTFNLPDMRGRFLRGVDGTAGRDPDKENRTATNFGNEKNNVGSLQDEQLKSHDHEVNTRQSASNTEYSSGFPRGNLYSATPNLRTQFTGGSETRPKNIYVNFIIKY